ncbi:MAG: 4Fe-4S binding protein [Candidatus Riflebacteria bacterium]|nr:4Fe-4S binding protein [Candidatus Riflebacteria bacterium]
MIPYWKIAVISTLIIAAIFICAVQVQANEEARFPRPDFSSGYKTPSPAQPIEAFEKNSNTSLILMVILIFLTWYALFIARSRTAIRVIGLFSLIWFGFLNQGCVCPIGSIQNVSLGIIDPSWPVSKNVAGVFFIPLITALFFGRLYCGASCPFGVLQDLVSWKSIKVNPVLDRCLRLIPFAWLGLGVYFATCGLGFIICRYDPFVCFFRMSGPVPIVISGAILLIIGTFVSRPFCRYLCPYSVLLAACSLLPGRKVQIFADNCVNCRLCRNSCPVDAIIPSVDLLSPNAFPEPAETATKRLKWLLAFSPAIIAACLYSGINLSEAVSQLHPKIILQNMITANNLKDDIVTAFFVNDGNIDLLRKTSREAKSRIRFAGGIFGIYMSLVFIGAIYAATRRKTNNHHTVEPWNCISCGRCYEWCPRNRMRIS